MSNSIYPLYGSDQRIDLLVSGGTTMVEFSGTLAASSPTITAIADTSALQVGMTVWGSQAPQTLPIGHILSKTSNTITLSENANTSGEGELLALGPTGGGGLAGNDVHLYQGTLAPTFNTTLAELVAAEATFDGYAAMAATWETGYLAPGGQQLAESDLLVWIPTGSTTPNSIGGAWVDDGTGAIEIWPLDNPITLSGPTTALKLVLFDGYPTPGFVTQVLP